MPGWKRLIWRKALLLALEFWLTPWGLPELSPPPFPSLRTVQSGRNLNCNGCDGGVVDGTWRWGIRLHASISRTPKPRRRLGLQRVRLTIPSPFFGHPRRNPVPHFRVKMRTWFRARLMGFITQRCRKAASILGFVLTCFSLSAGCRDVELVDFFAHARGIRQNAVAHQHGRNSCPVLSEHKIWPAHARSATKKRDRRNP